MAANRLYAEERLKKILECIKNNSTTDVNGLAKYFNVSGATVRTDLRELEMRNLIIRTHGGAVLRENALMGSNWYDPSYANRINLNSSKKEKIGRAASGLIQDDDTIMLDDGSTTHEVVRNLPKNKSLTVVTNGLNICMDLRDYPNVGVISVGGIFSKTDLSFNGKIAEQTAKKLHASKAILGATAISTACGVTTPEEKKAELKKIMIENSAQLIVVADSTKLEKVSLLPVCEIEKVHILVTDDQADTTVVSKYEALGVKVIIAQ